MNGNRSDYEEPYFLRREQLYTGAIMCLLYPEEPLYLERLQDVIWAICDEYSWLLPAHTFNVFGQINRVALFSAETGVALTEICYFLRDRLDADVLNRAEQLVRERIIKLYEENIFDWETLTMNWAAVCGSCVATVLMYLEPELFEKYESRLMKTMECFLSGYSDDGCCMEGIDYWQYGFGSFVYFADNYYRYTNGRVDLFENEKVKRIAAYGQKMMLCGGNTVSFADGFRSSLFHGAFIDFLHRRYPDTVIGMPPECKIYMTGKEDRWFDFSRGFLYTEVKPTETVAEYKDYYFRHAGQLIVNKKIFSFAVKAGSNAEPHNHNDVGSFIIADKTGQVLCDIGAGRYTYDYFIGGRYQILCCASFGHNLPIIDGEYQREGAEYSGEMLYNEGSNNAVLKLENAYRIPQLNSLTREFEWNDTCITLEDTFEGGMSAITERFVSLVKPVIGDGIISLGGVTLKFASESMSVSVSENKHKKHAPSENEIELIYCIDFKLETGAKKAKFVFEISD